MVSGSTGGTAGEKPRDRRTGLIFLLSLLIAFSIWLLHNLSLPYSVFIEYAVDVNTSMEGRAQRSESSDLLIIRGKADGYYILRQRFGRPKVLNVTVDPSSLVQYPDREDLFHVSCESIKGAIVEALGSNVELEFIVTQSLDFVLPNMEYRRVPIIPKLSLAFRSQYMQVGDISLNPDSIDIYGDARILGAIDSVMTETIAESNIDADLQGIVDIIPIRNVTYSDKNAYYYVRTERYIGESVELPVYAAGLPEGKEMILRTIDKDGNVLRTYTPFAGIDSERSLTYFSSIFGDRGNGREVVEVMMFLPQINIIDTESGSIQSVAVDRSYMKWKRIFGSMINMDMMNYYYGATTTPEYIVAAYRHLPLKEIGKPGYGTSIHVFDWDGDFLYDIRVNEDIGQMTYDSIHNRLYCLDVQGRVIRYDLSEIL